jgi:hypothetical protein
MSKRVSGGMLLVLLGVPFLIHDPREMERPIVSHGAIILSLRTSNFDQPHIDVGIPELLGNLRGIASATGSTGVRYTPKEDLGVTISFPWQSHDIS